MKYAAMPSSLIETFSTAAIEPVTKLSLSCALLLDLVILLFVKLGVGNSEKRLDNFFFNFLAIVLGS